MAGCEDCRRKRRGEPGPTEPILVRVVHEPPKTTVLGLIMFGITVAIGYGITRAAARPFV